MKHTFILTLILLSITSCIKEESTYSSTYLVNNTMHSIQLLPYFKGVISYDEAISIQPKSNILALSKSSRGKAQGLSYATYMVPYDSIYIVFDDSINAVHYRQNEQGKSVSAIKYDNKRNIYNRDNYEYKIISEEKYKIHTEYTFTFIEQDYLDAKEK